MAESSRGANNDALIVAVMALVALGVGLSFLLGVRAEVAAMRPQLGLVDSPWVSVNFIGAGYAWLMAGVVGTLAYAAVRRVRIKSWGGEPLAMGVACMALLMPLHLRTESISLSLKEFRGVQNQFDGQLDALKLGELKGPMRAAVMAAREPGQCEALSSMLGRMQHEQAGDFSAYVQALRASEQLCFSTLALRKSLREDAPLPGSQA